MLSCITGTRYFRPCIVYEKLQDRQIKNVYPLWSPSNTILCLYVYPLDVVEQTRHNNIPL